MLLALVVAEPNRSVRPPMPWSPDDLLFASAASLWEITIKVRLGKLDLDMQVEELPGYLEQVGFDLLPVTPPHAVYRALPEPPTRDPFDRLLLAQCAIENLRLVTLDRALVDHPLAYKPA
jgi:PIN domain nuclease of toxin-antitoxin system